MRKYVDVATVLRLLAGFGTGFSDDCWFILCLFRVGAASVVSAEGGVVQPMHNSDIPSWLTLDMELRGRTEDQTSLGYVSGKDRLYELTRVWGGMTVVPTNWLTFYAQFLDLHPLGLPLRTRRRTCATPST